LRRLSRSLVQVCLACAFAALLATGAVAHQYSAPTTTSLRYDETDGRFRGRVDSPRDPCLQQRKIKLVKHTDDGNEVVGRTRSNSRGRWNIAEGNASGAYSAVVVRRYSAPTGHVHQCQRGASGTVTVDP
jgi:hypothetical protein